MKNGDLKSGIVEGELFLVKLSAWDEETLAPSRSVYVVSDSPRNAASAVGNQESFVTDVQPFGGEIVLAEGMALVTKQSKQEVEDALFWIGKLRDCYGLDLSEAFNGLSLIQKQAENLNKLEKDLEGCKASLGFLSPAYKRTAEKNARLRKRIKQLEYLLRKRKD